MKNLVKLVGIIALVTAIGFLMTACDWTSSDDINAGKGCVKVINKTSSRIHLAVFRINAAPPKDWATTSMWIDANSENTTGRIPSGIQYYVGVTNFSGTSQYEDYSILYSSSSFTLEEGTTVVITFNGWSFQ